MCDLSFYPVFQCHWEQRKQKAPESLVLKFPLIASLNPGKCSLLINSAWQKTRLAQILSLFNYEVWPCGPCRFNFREMWEYIIQFKFSTKKIFVKNNACMHAGIKCSRAAERWFRSFQEGSLWVSAEYWISVFPFLVFFFHFYFYL
jgi:hypothetical protein